MSKLFVMSGDAEVAVYENNRLEITNERLAPLFLRRTRDFERWVSERAIESTRPNSRVLKKAHGLSRLSSDYETAMLYNAASVTDNFWVRTGSETWDDVRFDSDIYFKAAISSDNGILSYKPSKSPELTNIGSREKGWRLIGDEWWLYKNEPADRQLYELITCRIGKTLGMDMAEYEEDGGFIRSKDVTGGRYNLQHIDSIVYDHGNITDDDIKYNYETLLNLGERLAESYLEMKYLDALVNNVDRHTKNYALLTSRETGDIVKLAPNYDNDMAFYGAPEIFENKRERGEIHSFLDFLKVTKPRFDLPVPNRNALAEALSDIDDSESIIDYLMGGHALIQSILQE